jgi:hypothetical protein
MNRVVSLGFLNGVRWFLFLSVIIFLLVIACIQSGLFSGLENVATCSNVHIPEEKKEAATHYH